MTVLTFAPSLSVAGNPAPEDLAVVAVGRGALLAHDDQHGWHLPAVGELGEVSELLPIGAMNGRSVWLAKPASIPDGLHRVTWIDVLTAGTGALAEAAARGLHIAQWRDGHRFCGACGSSTQDVPGMIARRCTACGRFEHIKAQSVALVAVWRRSAKGPPEVLLARHTYGATQFWALVGGYLDAAERPEDAAVREVAEEVGIEVNELSYYGSEGWGIQGPGTMLMVFVGRAMDPTAEPVVDGKEIAEARFFPIDELPAETPPRPLIAGRVLADLPALLG